MRVDKISISGYKPIPFCAEYDPDNSTVTWEDEAFSLTLPTTSDDNVLMLNALMGANSSGKSSVLFALRDFFNNPTKLDAQLFNSEQTTKPIVVEISFRGAVTNPEEWHNDHCVNVKDNIFELTIIRGWSPDKRLPNFVRKQDGTLKKIGRNDKSFIDALLPKFRIIMADPKPSDEAAPKKDSLIYDLIDDMVQRATSVSSIVAKMRRLIQQFEELVARDGEENQDAWEAVKALEESLSKGLASITPQNSRVRLVPHRPMTTVNDIFLKGSVRINDGVELDFTQHGLGLQRSFVVSLLNTWCDIIAKNSEHDYLFAIEEPEIYLHPHATRVLLNELENIARNNQVLFTTHSSEFVNRVPLDQVFVVRRQTKGSLTPSIIQQPALTHISKEELVKVQRYLREDRSDMLFAKAALLVEGQAEFFAMPMFARTLEMDLDLNGVSIVHVNGINNIKVYHFILQAFNIPHVVMIDGDGQVDARRREYKKYADHLFVLDVDFEYMLASYLDESRLLAIINESRQRKGKCAIDSLEITPVTYDNIKNRWWHELHDKIKQDIPDPHRGEYTEQWEEIKNILQDMAQTVLENNHLAADSETQQKAKRLVKEGKPLVGRIAGELLIKEELERMTIIKESLQAVLELAQGKITITNGDSTE